MAVHRINLFSDTPEKLGVLDVTPPQKIRDAIAQDVEIHAAPEIAKREREMRASCIAFKSGVITGRI